MHIADSNRDLDAALVGNEPIPRERVLLWIEAASDLPTFSKLYRLTGESYYRIQPELGKETTCALIERYLLECMRQNVADNEDIESRWEAAQSLHAWLRKLVEMKDTADVLNRAAHAVTELFLESGEDVRGAIEQGFLEHALETAALRPYFEFWARDDRLRTAWKRALKWGQAHPNYTWEMLQRIRRTQGE
jgi:hypothetical protein